MHPSLGSGASAMNKLPLSERMAYWRSLARQGPIPDPRLYPGFLEELRAALRDALEEIQKEGERC